MPYSLNNHMLHPPCKARSPSSLGYVPHTARFLPSLDNAYFCIHPGACKACLHLLTIPSPLDSPTFPIQGLSPLLKFSSCYSRSILTLHLNLAWGVPPSPTPSTLNPQPSTLNPMFSAPTPQGAYLHHLHPQPSTLNPQTLNPKF